MPIGQDMQHTDATRTELTQDTVSAATYLFFGSETLYLWVSNIRAQENTIGSTTLVWNHPVQGFWGSFNWGTAIPDAEPEYVWNRDNHWEEQIYNTLYLDSTLTTATFNTSTHKIIGTANTTVDYYSTILYKGTSNVGSVLVEATETTPASTSINWYVSTDGGTVFQPITLGVTTALTVGLSLILRAELVSTHVTNFAEIEDITVDYIFA